MKKKERTEGRKLFELGHNHSCHSKATIAANKSERKKCERREREIVL